MKNRTVTTRRPTRTDRARTASDAPAMRTCRKSVSSSSFHHAPACARIFWRLASPSSQSAKTSATTTTAPRYSHTSMVTIIGDAIPGWDRKQLAERWGERQLGEGFGRYLERFMALFSKERRDQVRW